MNNNNGKVIIFLLIFIILVLPMIPKENCLQFNTIINNTMVGYNVACINQHVSILQLMFGK